MRRYTFQFSGFLCICAPIILGALINVSSTLAATPLPRLSPFIGRLAPITATADQAAIGDFDEDGYPELLLHPPKTQGVRILRKLPEGRFSADVDIPVGCLIQGLAIA